MFVGKYLRASSDINEHQTCLEDANMGRRRKKVIHIPKKKLPKFFSCPRCGKETVRVDILRDEGRAKIRCSNCQLQEEFPIKLAQGEVDVYCMFTDKIYGKSRRSSTTPSVKGA
jgi:transcription elongation factor Elf1